MRVSAGIAAAAAVAFVSIFSYNIYESSGSKAVEFASVSGKSRVSLPDGSDATLDKVCHDLSKWYGVNVVLADNLVGKGCINFTITDESLESVLSIISATTRVNYRFESPKSAIVY